MDELETINPLLDIVDKDEEKRIFTEIAKIEGASEYFRLMMAQDMRLFFVTKPEEQGIVKGAYYRTRLFAKLLKENSVK